MLGRSVLKSFYNVKNQNPLLKNVLFFKNKTFSTMNNKETTKRLVLEEKVDKVYLIGINRQEKRNAVNHETAKALVEAFNNFEGDDSSLVAVLYGVGGTFCAGYDLSEVSQGTEELNKIKDEWQKFRPMGPTMMRFSKPVIGAISGYAVAGGLELSLMCDIRIVEESAVFGVFCRRFGVPLIDGGTIRLPKVIGLSRAMDMILTGRSVDAKTALEWGLANQVVATGTALGRAVYFAQGLTKFPQECMNIDRSSVYYSTFDSENYDDAFRFELEKGLNVLEKESVKGAQKFVTGVGKHGSFNLNPQSKL